MIICKFKWLRVLQHVQSVHCIFRVTVIIRFHKLIISHTTNSFGPLSRFDICWRHFRVTNKDKDRQVLYHSRLSCIYHTLFFGNFKTGVGMSLPPVAIVSIWLVSMYLIITHSFPYYRSSTMFTVEITINVLVYPKLIDPINQQSHEPYTDCCFRP